ncbi:beta-amylase 1, chloroplastic [Tanacetum coccineum]
MISELIIDEAELFNVVAATDDRTSRYCYPCGSRAGHRLPPVTKVLLMREIRSRTKSWYRRGKANTSIGNYDPVEVQREYPSSSISNKEERGVPVYVMMPLAGADLCSSFKDLNSAGVEGVMVDVWWGLVEEVAGNVTMWNNRKVVKASFKDLKSAGVEGVMVDVWYKGLCRFINVVEMLATLALISYCKIPLPMWVVKDINKDPDLAYTDQWGRRNYDYLSLGCGSPIFSVTPLCLKAATDDYGHTEWETRIPQTLVTTTEDTIFLKDNLVVGTVNMASSSCPVTNMVNPPVTNVNWLSLK